MDDAEFQYKNKQKTPKGAKKIMKGNQWEKTNATSQTSKNV